MRPVLLLLSGLLLAGAPAGHCIAQSSPPQRSTPAGPYDAYIAEASQRFGIPATWIRAVMRAESAGDPGAISSAGAMGLMQIMPATWRYLRTRYRLGGDPYHPRDNIIGGTAYLREMYDRYGSPGFLAAYNAGPGRYEAWLAGRPLPRETRAYVAAITPALGGDGAAPTPAIAPPDPFAWTRAPIFIAASNSAPVAAPVPDDGPPADAPSAPTPRNSSAADPHASGLFVAPWGAARSQ